MKNATKHLAGLICLALAAVPAAAQDGKTDITKKIGLEQKLGAEIPLNATFRDETGKSVKLGDYFGERPVALSLVFYGCKGSCLLIRDGMIKTFNAQKKLEVGKDFDVLVVSVHPKETPQMAMAAKKFWTESYRVQGTEPNWHFLVGDMENIRKLTDAVGFKFYYDEAKDALSHPAGLILLTPQGVASHYMYGATYAAKEFMDSVQLAAKEQVGQKSEEFLLGCLQYDPSTGKYRVVVEQTLKVMGFATVAILFGSIAFMSLRYRGVGQSPSHEEGEKS